MTRYPAGHRERTRRQILDAAARVLREKGVDGTSVADVMASAGLTHGGFYAHFPNKDALVAEACRSAVDQTGEALGAVMEDVGEEDRFAAYLRAYLSRTHRDDPGAGCLMPPLAGEMPRQPPEVRAAFTGQVRRALERTEANLPPGVDPAEREDVAIAVLAGMAGAMMLARAVDDPALSDRILRATRHVLTETFGAAGD
ncbi:MAG TPA: TetR/AcrR family transcriptional regulator [Longimicrobium sp.]|jgi:TetR/AcrR family transcriptional repressor of nem operon|uniref:TetR/AcrR family transcriptional regulator n=1 Tax=Longimicrobium sp. TaxID=2029185 RepID=UPI002ED816E3